jgi:alpha-N-acetylglucosaminidase
MFRASVSRGLVLAGVLGATVVASLGNLGAEEPSRPAKQVAQEEAVRGLLGRVIPQHADRFTLQLIPGKPGKDVFEIESAGDKVVVRGSSSVAMASGVNWYLMHHCHCDISWCGDQLNLPERLPVLQEKLRRETPFAHRYFFNYCAFSYTMAWWDWPQWERMIDWMALHGINMPLAVTGQEAVWQAVGRRLGLSDAQVGEFFVGPAYLPFGWMGCMDGWGGPLPPSWIDGHRDLQQKILARQRALGMTPVLQGFTGHVPTALKEKFPQARFRQLPSWCGFPGTWFLDPLDPLFRQVGKMFVEEQTKLFGTDHLYASDTFIEMSPPSSDPAFLTDMGRAVLGAMQDADPEAVWVMQGWLFINNPGFWKPPQNRALLNSVPHGRMLVLDLMCETNPAWRKTEAFYGQPWIFCILQTFGDTVSLHGGLPQTAANLRQAMTDPKAGQLRGLGHIMEGLGCNPVIHDFLADMTWRREVPQLQPWLGDYVRRRYGRSQPKAQEAWQVLSASVYSSTGPAGTLICSRPGLQLGGSPASLKVAQAWKLLLEAADDLKEVDTYQFDLVNVSRQALGGLAGPIYGDILAAYQAKDRKALAEGRRRLLELIADLDELLGTRRELLLGRWIADARHWATDDAQRRLYEWNARNQITLWGPRDSVLHEYAQKQWSGMMRGFYGRRWERFLDRLDASLAAGTPWDAEPFEKDIRAWEEQWTHGSEPYAAEPQGNPVAVSARLWEKYHKTFFDREAVSLTTDKPASCSHALSPYPADLANDGRSRDTDSYWATDAGTDSAAWWQVDLEKPTTIGRVVVVFYYGDRRQYGFKVETSLDGKQWELAADRQDNQEPSTSRGITCQFPPRSARWLRVTVTRNSANTGRHLVEVMAYEK